MKAHEHERYTLDRCAVQAKFLFSPKPPKPPHPVAASPSLSPSTGTAEPGTSQAAAAAAAVGEERDKPAEDEGEEEGLGSCPATMHGGVAGSTRQAEKDRGARRDVLGARRSRREEEGGVKEGGTDDEEEEEDHGHDGRSPRSGRGRWRGGGDNSGDDTRTADGATQETAMNDSVQSKKSRRKAKGKGGALREGAGASDEVKGVAGEGTCEEVPVALSRKQERARNGRRQRPI